MTGSALIELVDATRSFAFRCRSCNAVCCGNCCAVSGAQPLPAKIGETLHAPVITVEGGEVPGP
jgi:hypothetical protein